MPKYMIHPVKDRVTQGFKANPAWYRRWIGQKGHNGIDYGSPFGTPVKATADGTVVFEGWGHPWAGSIAGLYILVKHRKAYSGYAHLSRTLVDRGQKVKGGQVIGYTGNSGKVTGPHLHFETLPLHPDFNNGFYGRVDPATYKLGKPDTKAVPKPKPKPTKKPSVPIYTVKKGDTLSAIAAKYKTTWQKLAKINKLRHPDVIEPGQKIKLR
jgi:murein DD-endopeptidase MepM/ murein hydrolase activator NlpD